MQVSKQVMKAIQVSLNLFEVQMNLETGPGVAFLEVIAELKDPGEISSCLSILIL